MQMNNDWYASESINILTPASRKFLQDEPRCTGNNNVSFFHGITGWFSCTAAPANTLLHLDRMTVCDVTGDARRDGRKDCYHQTFFWALLPKVCSKSQKSQCFCCFLFSLCDVKICKKIKLSTGDVLTQEVSQLSKLWLWAPCCILTTQWPIKNFQFGPFKKKEVLGPPILKKPISLI